MLRTLSWWILKTWRWRLHRLPGQPIPLPVCAHLEKKFSLYDISICLVLISVCFLSYSHYAQPLCHFYNLHRYKEATVMCPVSHSKPSRPDPSVSPQRGTATDPDWGWTGGPPVNLFHCINILLVMGRLKIGNTIPGMV